jgi:hypothetical protein
MTRCLKCAGCLHYEQDEWGGPVVARCINCGARPLLALRAPDDEFRKQGAFLPVIVEQKRT